jgi:hypothetical protein
MSYIRGGREGDWATWEISTIDPENGFLHSHRRENLKSYMFTLVYIYFVKE